MVVIGDMLISGILKRGWLMKMMMSYLRKGKLQIPILTVDLKVDSNSECVEEVSKSKK